MNEVKAAGKYRQEGKSYVVQDGDIIHFQFVSQGRAACFLLLSLSFLGLSTLQ
jgi:hypothetical protein